MTDHAVAARDERSPLLASKPHRARTTRMFREAAQAPSAVRLQLQANASAVADLARRLIERPPTAVVTLARGSSDNAATLARYLIETRLQILTASAAPSVASVYDAAPAMDGVLALVISQSGRSPDILASAAAAKAAGAIVAALVNDASSPLAEAADVVIPLHAGRERSVAATKSFIAALAGVLQLVATWAGDDALLAALRDLPGLLQEAWELDWSAALPVLTSAEHLYVVGRGPGLAMAQEAALKFKETCGLHAEAFSSAEVRHGPMTLVGPAFPVLAFLQRDETLAGVEAALAAFAAEGAPVLATGPSAVRGVRSLPVVGASAAIAPVLQIQSFYRMANDLALARGFDPDRPRLLAKDTKTV